MLRKVYDMLSRLDTIPERDRQTGRRTDGQTDGQNCCINIVLLLTSDKNMPL